MSAPAAPTVQVVDTYDDAARLVEKGVEALSRATLGAVQAQVESSTAELQVLGKAHAVVGAAYAEALDNVKDLGEFHKAHAAMVASLAPHLATVDELEVVVAELEEAARNLDGQTKALEAVFSNLL